MAFLKVEKVAIRGISGCVPSNVEENKDLPFYAPGEAEQVIANIGIKRKHICPEGMTSSDLCYSAAEELIRELGWSKDSIDLLAYVTQDPDYLNHPTSFVVHEKLGLPQTCMCVDYYHGCPGWVVGLSSVSSMISTGSIKRAILLDGDMVSHDLCKTNREERPLFGDAGTATAIEFDETAKPMYFSVITKSADGKALARENGGWRNPFTLETLKADIDRRAGNLSIDKITDKMDGMDVFSFAITTVPKSIKQFCNQFNLDVAEVNNLVLHQANAFMLKTIAKRLKVSMERVPTSLREFGNTTSASIPLTIVAQCAEAYHNSSNKTLVCGFGTGLACACAYFETDKIVCPNIIEI